MARLFRICYPIYGIPLWWYKYCSISQRFFLPPKKAERPADWQSVHPLKVPYEKNKLVKSIIVEPTIIIHIKDGDFSPPFLIE